MNKHQSEEGEMIEFNDNSEDIIIECLYDAIVLFVYAHHSMNNYCLLSFCDEHTAGNSTGV